MKAQYLSLWALAGSAYAYLATTTRYFDGQEGACGCGENSGLDSWQTGISQGVYTAAGSQALFDTDGSSWCGGGCGKCYNLTSTGTSACNGCGEGGVAGESIIVMVTNLCPYNGNEQWCPSVGAKNEYGYSYHFDVMAQSQVFGDNVVVNFEPVTCPGQAALDWETCVCYGKTASDSTPAGFASAGAPDPASTLLPLPSAPTSATTSTSVKAASETPTSPVGVVVPTSIIQATTAPASSPASSPVESSPTSLATTAAPNSQPLEAVTTSTYSLFETTVVTETITVWTTPTVAATPTSGGPGAVQTLYGQCGGINWTGATTCATGATCKVQNPYYSQCISSA